MAVSNLPQTDLCNNKRSVHFNQKGKLILIFVSF